MFKRIPQGVRTFFTIEYLILRTLFFRLFFDPLFHFSDTDMGQGPWARAWAQMGQGPFQMIWAQMGQPLATSKVTQNYNIRCAVLWQSAGPEISLIGNSSKAV